MLTFWGDKHSFCDRVSRRDFLRIGACGMAGLDPGRRAAFAGSVADRHQAAGRHHGLPGGRAQPHRHVRHEARRPGRLPRRIQADQDQRAWLRHLRAHADAGQDRRQAGPGPHRAVRRADAARTGRGLHRLPQVGEAAVVRLGHQPLPRWPTASCPPTSASNTATAPSATRARSTWGPPIGPCTLPATAGVRNLSLPYGMNRAPAGRPARHAAGLRRLPPRTRRPPREPGHGRLHRPGVRHHHLAQGPRTPSTSAASRTRCASATATRDDKYIYVGTKADSLWDGQKFLLARRLVEAGVPVVTLRAGGWDHHGNVGRAGGGQHLCTVREDRAAAAGPLDPCPGHRPARTRPGQGSGGAGLGRVRPDAEDLAGRPRSLAGRGFRPVRRGREERAR